VCVCVCAFVCMYTWGCACIYVIVCLFAFQTKQKMPPKSSAQSIQLHAKNETYETFYRSSLKKKFFLRTNTTFQVKRVILFHHFVLQWQTKPMFSSHDRCKRQNGLSLTEFSSFSLFLKSPPIVSFKDYNTRVSIFILHICWIFTQKLSFQPVQIFNG